MRVLHVIDSLSASGGAEHGMVREIVRFSSSVEQRLVRLFANDALEEEVLSAGIEVDSLGLDASRAGRNWPTAVTRLGESIRRFEPDVVHSSLFSGNTVAQLAGRRAGIPVLSTFTLSGDVDLLRRFQPGADSWRASVLRTVAGYAARSPHVWFRALTEDTRSTNARLLRISPDRVTVVPRGLPSVQNAVEPKTRGELGLPEDVPVLLNVGRQTAQKGHVALVEVFEKVRAARPCHLVILGREGDTSEDLGRAIAESGHSEDITVIAYTPDVAHFLAQASVFVFPSYMEGLGTAVIEALTAGVPVVAFDIPPVREATGDGRYGRLVPVDDVTGMADAVMRVLDDPRPARSSEAAVWARDNYAIDSVATRVETLLEQVASQPRG
jgi:glycosyltransferase involved in cell wall biosynthesis